MTTSVAQQHILADDDNVDVVGLFTEPLDLEGDSVSRDGYVDRSLARITELEPHQVIIDSLWTKDDDGSSVIQMLGTNPSMETVPIIPCLEAIIQVREAEGHPKTTQRPTHR